MPVMPREILTGESYDDALCRLFVRRGWTRIAVVTGDRFEGGTGFTAVLREKAPAVMVERWRRPPGHGSAEWVERVVTDVLAFDPHVVVTAGGGSSHDSGKGIVALAALGGRLEDHCIRFRPPTQISFPDLSGAKLPLVSVPSTFSGSESNGAAGFTGKARHGKRVLADPSLVPTAVVIDPRLAGMVQRDVLLGSAMNALNHCIEGMASRRPEPTADFCFSAALPALGGLTFDEAGQPTEEWLSRGLVASTMTGAAMAGTWLGIAHAIGHVLGATYGVPHGACHAVMAGACIRFNAAVAGPAHERAAHRLGLDGGSEALASWMDARAAEWGLPTRLRDLGVEPNDLADLAPAIWADHDTFFNPRRPVGPEEIVALLEEAL